jgi:hypothetical protein
MKPIGYYIQLSDHEQTQITNATAWQLSDLVSSVACSLSGNLAIEDAADDYLDVNWTEKSDRDKLALIRALCDRIEQKLMEAAK